MVESTKKRSLFGRLLMGRTIRKQMYAVYFVAMVLPIVALGTVLVLGTHKMLTQYHSDLMNSENVRVKNLMFEFTTQVKILSENVVSDINIQNVLTENYDTVEDFRRSANKVVIMDRYKNTYLGISSIAIYSENPDVVDYKQFYAATEAVKNTEWYQKAVMQSGAFWTTMTETSNSGVVTYYLSLVRKVPLVQSPYEAVLVMRISDDYLRSGIVNSFYDTFISVGYDDAFFSSDRSLEGDEMPMYIDREKAYYQGTEKLDLGDRICYAQVSTLNTYQSESKIYVCTINKEGYYEIWHILAGCFIILAVAIILPGLMIGFFTHYLTGRIDVLRQEMHKASRQDYELIPVIHGQDEISEAYADLQIMVENIKTHEAHVYEAKIKEQQLENKQHEMEYMMLASQINPHFLYNTLETIRMKAFTAGDRDVADAIKLLGKSMRYVLENTGTSRTTLAKELEHVEVYLKIQQLRFGDRFDFTLDVEEGVNCEQIYLLPLLLQPVVENSVVHGLEKLDENGHIRVEIYTGMKPRKATYEEENSEDAKETEYGERMLFIDILDNGPGMDAGILETLRNNIETVDISRSKSIGLYNINQRLMLSYGREYPLCIDAKEGVGTRVRLTIPTRSCMD